MPRLDKLTDDEMEVLGTGAFQFSGAKMETLEGSSEYTLVILAIDVSYSLIDFRDQLIKLAKSCIKAAQHDDNAERIMYRIVTFSTDVMEIQGFKPVDEIDVDAITFDIYSSTALYDGTQDGIESVFGYGTALAKNDYSINAILFTFTDGMDNASKSASASSVKRGFDNIRRSKDSADGIESINAILIGMNASQCKNYLEDFSVGGGFDQYIDAGDLDDATIKRIGNFVSKSVSSQSQAIGTGGPSQIASF